MKQPYFLIFVIIIFVSPLLGQEPSDDELVVRKMADNILENADSAFYYYSPTETYKNAADIPDGVRVRTRGQYGGWWYSLGVLNIAMIHLSDFLNEEKYLNLVKDHIAFGFKSYRLFEKQYQSENNIRRIPFHQFIWIQNLDDCGAMAASVIEVYKRTGISEYREYLERVSEHILNSQERFEDGTLSRSFPHELTLWADDLYMSVPFLARMGDLTREVKYFDDAILQVENFNKYLWDPNKKLYYHCYYSDLKRNGVAHWGRCNGWMIMAQLHLIEFLPKDHPKRESLIALLERQILGIAKYQNGDGLWHQLLDKNDSYAESSCTSMFVYAIAKAVNEGWIDKRYASIAIHQEIGLSIPVL